MLAALAIRGAALLQAGLDDVWRIRGTRHRPSNFIRPCRCDAPSIVIERAGQTA